MKFSLFHPVTVGSGDRLGTGLLGLEPQLYTAAVAGLREQAIAADESGWNSLMLAERHFEVEGYQVTPNPLLLNVYLAQHTKRLRHGQMGLMLPAWNPLRLAEDIAIADHLTGGRLDVGLSRGHPARAGGVLGHRGADEKAAAERDRELFEEWFEIMLLAWTEELLSYEGNFLRIPTRGVPWPHPTSERLGAGVKDGVLTALGTVPKPLQAPHPPLYTTTAGDPQTVQWAARVGSALITTATLPHRIREVTETYAGTAAASGTNVYLNRWRPGGGVALCRLLAVAPTHEQALRTGEQAMPFLGDRLGALGFFENAATGGSAPRTLQELVASGVMLLGTPDTVGEQVTALIDAYGVDHLVLVACAGATDHDRVLQTITLFGEKVIPRLGAAL